jgi:hypothetical protein
VRVVAFVKRFDGARPHALALAEVFVIELEGLITPGQAQ